jgi:glyceraldehyde-3-phosphate dehydrogenase (NAD(P))
MPNIVHVVGTGTIGEPLIGLLCHKREALGIDGVTFHKKSAIVEDRSKIRALVDDGAVLASEPESFKAFSDLGVPASLSVEEALSQASVVIDCTAVGNSHKEKVYTELGGAKGFIAQGSEFGFGKPYARGINDRVLSRGEDRFLQVVSCNTHNMAAIINTLAMDNGNCPDNLLAGRFVCMRRANDISQDGSYIPAPQAGKHDDSEFGTHHARDAWHLFQTLGLELDLFSSAIKLNTQYMHALWFNLQVKRPTSMEALGRAIEANRRVAVTHKKSANQVFSFGRDHGYYGRILSQTVIPVRALTVHRGTEITGFCYTPQDGNSLLSSVAAATWFLHPGEVDTRLDCLRPYMFQEV